jgi:hypothetical protein
VLKTFVPPGFATVEVAFLVEVHRTDVRDFPGLEDESTVLASDESDACEVDE